MRRVGPLLALASLALVLLGGGSTVRAEPNALLFGATLDEARAIAMDSAILKGWQVVEIDASSATFEQVLEEDEWNEVPVLLIQVQASFVQEPSGVRVLLHASEVELPYTAEEWVYDVTDQYAENLDNALSKLRARWDAERRGSDADITDSPAAPTPYAGTDTATGSAGTWAYYAERYARSRGCRLGDQGAVLEGAGQDWEHHRIRCLDGSVMHVRCRHGDCTSAR